MEPGSDLQAFVESLGAALLVVVAALLLIVLGAYFGMVSIAARIRRALDRAEAEDEDPGDRHD